MRDGISAGAPRKRLLIAAAALVLGLLLCCPARAAELGESFGADSLEEALPESAAEVLEGWDGEDAQSGLEKLASAALDGLEEELGELLAPACRMLAVIILCSAAGSLRRGGGFDYVGLAGCLGVALIFARDFDGLLSLGKSTMAELSDFSKALLPTLCTAAVAAGATGSAPAKYAATAMFLDVLINAVNSLIFPLVCAYTAAVTASAALGEGRLRAVTRLLRGLCRLALGTLVTAFTLYLSLTGIIAASTDALATKAARTAISAALPVVGRIISDAAGSVVAGAGLLRASVGVFGLIAVLALCLMPFVQLGLRYLLLKAVSAAAELTAGGRLPELTGGLADACGMILGAVGAQALFIFISVISMLKAVTG